MAHDEHEKNARQLWKCKVVMGESGDIGEGRGESGHNDIQPSQSQSSNQLEDNGFISNFEVEKLAIANNIEKTELIQKTIMHKDPISKGDKLIEITIVVGLQKEQTTKKRVTWKRAQGNGTKKAEARNIRGLGITKKRKTREVGTQSGIKKLYEVGDVI